MAKRELINLQEQHPKTLLLGIYTPENKIHDMDGYFEEFKNLVKTLGIKFDITHFIKIRMVDPSHFLTKGKLEEIRKICEDSAIEEVVCSCLLTPLQARNLSSALDCTVYDRTQLILEIFKNAAHSAEGKIQVEIAELEYYKTRLAGRGKELMQQIGYIGTRGPGETEKELLKRVYAGKIAQAKKRLEALQKSREVQRKKRLLSQIPQIAIVGYTNSGKSTLLNQLTKSHVLAEDKLFATLDTTTRELFLSDKKKVLISDTVGFISELPHHLIEAFKSTLQELKYADLILHVVDISDHMWEDQLKVAEEILQELQVTLPVLYLFNKVDKAENIAALQPHLQLYSPNVLTSAISKQGIEELLEYLRAYKFER